MIVGQVKVSAGVQWQCFSDLNGHTDYLPILLSVDSASGGLG